MKRLLLTLFIVGAFGCAITARAYESPGKPTGFVNDFAGIFSTAEKAGLADKLSAFEKETGAEISVVTVKSLGGDTAQNFGTELFRDWGIGKKGIDNGLLFLVAPEEKEVRIEVGYGLEPTVTDGATSVILRSVVLPAFKEGNYFAGVEGGLDKIMGLIKNDPEAVQFVADAQAAPAINWEAIVFVIILIIILSTRRGRKMLPYILWSGIGRGGFGGGSSGGFGGFGGGRSGGGGAGGKW